MRHPLRPGRPSALIVLLLAAGLLAPAFARAAPEADSVPKLIEQLGSADAARRQEAAKRLEAAGESALEALRKASRSHEDADVRLRAGLVARAIEKRLAGPVRDFKGHTDLVRSLALSADGSRLLTGSHDRTLRLWDVSTGKEVRRFDGCGSEVRGVALSRDGKRALSGEQGGVLSLWDVATGKRLRQARFTTPVCSVAFTPDGRQALLGLDDASLRLWDVGAWKELRQLRGHTSYVVCVAVSADGKRGLSAGEHDKTVRLWDLATGKELRKLEGHKESVHCVAFSPDGKQAVSGGGGYHQGGPFVPGSDNAVRLWDLGTGKEVRQFKGHGAGVWSVAFAADGRRVLSGSGHWTLESPDKTVRLWDAATGKELRRLDQHTGTVWAVAFTPDGKQALSAGDSTVYLWPLPR